MATCIAGGLWCTGLRCISAGEQAVEIGRYADRRHYLPEGLAETGLRWRSGARFVVGWKGHVYVPGKTAGHDSIGHLIMRLEAGEGLDGLMGEL